MHDLRERDAHGSPLIDAPPTNVRQRVLAFLCVMSFILYLDRICISQAVKLIEEDLDISDTNMGFVLGSFILAYGLFEVPIGHWGDRYGSRKVLTWHRVDVVGVDHDHRAGERSDHVAGGAFSVRSRASRRLSQCDQVAGTLVSLPRPRFRHGHHADGGPGRRFPGAPGCRGIDAPLRLALDVRGPGRARIALGGLVSLVVSRRPRRPSRRQRGGAPPTSPSDAAPRSMRTIIPPFPWAKVLGSANVWLMGTISICSSFTTYLFFSWYPTYLQKGRSLTSGVASEMAIAVLISGAVGSFCGGYLSDWLVRLTGERTWSRRLLAAPSLACAALGMVLSIHCDDPWLAALSRPGPASQSTSPCRRAGAW